MRPAMPGTTSTNHISSSSCLLSDLVRHTLSRNQAQRQPLGERTFFSFKYVAHKTGGYHRSTFPTRALAISRFFLSQSPIAKGGFGQPAHAKTLVAAKSE